MSWFKKTRHSSLRPEIDNGKLVDDVMTGCKIVTIAAGTFKKRMDI
jgi:hypothetical protein